MHFDIKSDQMYFLIWDKKCFSSEYALQNISDLNSYGREVFILFYIGILGSGGVFSPHYHISPIT